LPIFGGCVSYFTHRRVEPEFRQILDPAAFAFRPPQNRRGKMS
jgi:hypothetical protein